MSDIVDRVVKARTRIPNLFHKYPVVGYAIVLAGFLIGLAIGWLIWH